MVVLCCVGLSPLRHGHRQGPQTAKQSTARPARLLIVTSGLGVHRAVALGAASVDTGLTGYSGQQAGWRKTRLAIELHGSIATGVIQLDENLDGWQPAGVVEVGLAGRRMLGRYWSWLIRDIQKLT